MGACETSAEFKRIVPGAQYPPPEKHQHQQFASRELQAQKKAKDQCQQPTSESITTSQESSHQRQHYHLHYGINYDKNDPSHLAVTGKQRNEQQQNRKTTLGISRGGRRSNSRQAQTRSTSPSAGQDARHVQNTNIVTRSRPDIGQDPRSGPSAVKVGGGGSPASSKSPREVGRIRERSLDVNTSPGRKSCTAKTSRKVDESPMREDP